jgi:hypothetical protein
VGGVNMGMSEHFDLDTERRSGKDYPRYGHKLLRCASEGESIFAELDGLKSPDFGVFSSESLRFRIWETRKS